MTITKTSITLRGHRTSFSLEAEFMALLKACAKDRGLALAELVAQVDEMREGNLSSALRLFVLREVSGDQKGPALEAAVAKWLAAGQTTGD